MERKLGDALPGGDQPVRVAVWALLRPILSPRLTALNRDAFVPGGAEYVGDDTAGRPLRVRVLGRDAQEAQRLARRWRSLAYRDPPRSVR